MIATATAGFDHIDTAYCAANGIAWANSPGCNALSVGQYVVSCLSRLNMCYGKKPEQQVMGIVGVGNVGKQVCRLAQAMGYKVLLCDPPRVEAEGLEDFVSLETIAEECDVITFHVPLTKAAESAHPTYHLINQAFLRSCKRKPILLNACRGAVADTMALIEAKRISTVRALVIDCWEGEPHINEDLLRLADIATPHIAGFSADGKANGSRMALASVLNHFGIADNGYLQRIMPPPPANPLIDLSLDHSYLAERALLATFDPLPVDRYLRQHLDTFEDQRKRYNYHREMAAFTVKGYPQELKTILAALDFNLGAPLTNNKEEQSYEN